LALEIHPNGGFRCGLLIIKVRREGAVHGFHRLVFACQRNPQILR
jgi:hypothetical protein